MAKRTLNLIYSDSQFAFFSHVKKANEIILNFKKNEAMHDFGPRDESEVGRGASYAVFPELKTLANSGSPITLQALRDSLVQRGVTDITMQNKVMACLLQGQAGLHYGMGSILTGMLLSAGYEFLMSHEYDVRLEVTHGEQIKLIYQGGVRDIYSESDEPSIVADIEINITPTKVVIDKYKLSQVVDDEKVSQAFDYFNKNQANILEKLILLLKNLFGINRSTELENVKKDGVAWPQASTQSESLTRPTC